MGGSYLSRRKLIFFWFPVALAVAISIEYYILAEKREVLSAKETFAQTVDEIRLELQEGWQITQMHPEMIASAIVAYGADDGLSRVDAGSFEKMASSNPYWDPRKTVLEVWWVPHVAAGKRASYEETFEVVFSRVTGSAVTPLEDSAVGPFAPVMLISPPDSSRRGHDLYSDSFEGPLLRKALETGETLVSLPFKMKNAKGHFRITDASPDMDYVMASTIYKPLYLDSQGEISHAPSSGSEPLGAVVTQVQMQPLLTVLDLIRVEVDGKSAGLEEMDVFLFQEPPLSSDGKRRVSLTNSHILGVYEGGPDETRKGLSIYNTAEMTPGGVDGDFVTKLDDEEFMIKAGDRNFLIVVRGREGRYVARFLTFLPATFMMIGLIVKFIDKSFAIWEEKYYRESDKAAAVEEYLLHEEQAANRLEEAIIEEEEEELEHFGSLPSSPDGRSRSRMGSFPFPSPDAHSPIPGHINTHAPNGIGGRSRMASWAPGAASRISLGPRLGTQGARESSHTLEASQR
eukprot:CAMPEP_0180278274 /NCGR_PEP_ID=MMETSP0988-20121125/7392_1 /TAXON_ID=697907 /ORGANISM="non described non described, Strain CCMP2293" /LENGTH=514 /DNA_ID=CAMNT_0022249803 /DNA_START=37 /DNA_END=1578 /DNA_ORIENTATION=+